MKTVASRSLGILLGVLLLSLLTLLDFFEISALDTWFHLKAGELYVTTHSLPVRDPFAFTTQGREWINYSWLTDVLFYFVYAATGSADLVVLQVCLLLAVALLYGSS